MSIENDMKSEAKSGRITIIIIFTIIFIIGVILWLPGGHHKITRCLVCQSNLKLIGLAMIMYAQDNSNKYPTPEKWCDLLISEMGKSWRYGDIEDCLQCPEAKIRDVNCHYAMNPNCTTQENFSSDTVLLFETKSGGWNLTGGPELATTENHKEKVCNVLFNDGSVKRIKKGEIDNYVALFPL